MDLGSMSSEMVEMLCEQMDFKTLSRYMQTSFQNKEICEKVFEKRKKDDILILWAEEKVVETENIELDFIFKNPKFFEYIVDGLAESHLQYSNPGLIEVSMENPQIL